MKRKTNIKVLIAAFVIATLFVSIIGCSRQGASDSLMSSSNEIHAEEKSTETSVEMKGPTLVDKPTPQPTPTIQPSPTPTLAPTNTPEPIPTLVPTNTPAPLLEGKLITSLQMGDNIWFDCYDDYTLYVRGDGATYSFKSSSEYFEHIQKDPDMPYPYEFIRIIIEEGITEIGDYGLYCFSGAEEIYIPSTLKKIGTEGFMGAGYGMETMEGYFPKSPTWHGLDLTKLDFKEDSFVYSNGVESFDGSEKLILIPTPTPLPPTPTPTPLPDPDKPRIVRTESMGKNVVYEFWDNGYLYIKGSGPVTDKGFGFGWYDERYYYEDEWYERHEMSTDMRDMYWDDYSLPRDFCDTVTHVIVEEGITELGSYTLGMLKNISYVQLPSTLNPKELYTGSGQYIEMFQSGYHGKTELHGYWEGEAFVLLDVNLDDVLGSMWYMFKEKRPVGFTFMEKYGEQIIWE